MESVRHLSIDIETYSDIDISKAGLYKYAESPAFEVMLLAYSIDGGPVEVIDLTEGPFPTDLYTALISPEFVKHAYNAAFEWYCLSKYLHTVLPLTQWRCTMLHGLYCGYPAGLAAIGNALGLSEDKKKMAAGKALIKYFCVPCAPTKNNGQRTRNLPHHAPEKWQTFKEYCAQDVRTEMEVEAILSAFPVPEEVQTQWVTDTRINARGVKVDTEFVAAALALDDQSREQYLKEAMAITGLDNPNSVAKLTEWLQAETELDIKDLRKDTVSALLGKELPSDKAHRVLEIRKALSKTSNKKYEAIRTAVCADGRVRGLLQFYGANRTGRWAGRIVQPQNLPRTYIKADLLPIARTLVKQEDSASLQWVFGSVPDTLSQLIRTALVASQGRLLLDADFSAIEARVIAWLAGEEWVLEVFRTHGKIYEATASQMFGIPIEHIKKGRPEYSYRQKGKVATLALGYQGGPGALIAMGALDNGLTEEELPEIVDRWRKANPHIAQLWNLVEAAAREAVETGRRITLREGSIVIAREYDPMHGLNFLTITLPNGRKLFYAKPHIGVNRFGRPSLCYYGMDQSSKKWKVLETYGGKLVENITQAVARDCLAEAIERLEQAGFPVVFHIHDEIIVDAPSDKQNLSEMERLMGQTPVWAQGLPLSSDGWANEFFKKD